MAIIQASGVTTNWSLATTWTGGVVPGNGDTVDLNGQFVIQDIATVPAAGTLALINDASGGGQFTCGMTGANNYALNCAVITAKDQGSTGVVSITGASATGTYTVTCTTINGGTSGSTVGLSITGSGKLIINGNIVAGSATNCHGAKTSSTGSTTINGNITGSATSSGAGFMDSAASGTLTVNGNVTGGSANAAAVGISSTGVVTTITGNIINGAGALAFQGKPPVWNITGKVNYIQFAAVNLDGAGNAAVQFGVALAKGLVLSGTAGYFTDGTFLGTRVDCPVIDALVAASYGDPASPLSGTVVLPATTDVRLGTTFGDSGSLTGTLVAGGGFHLLGG